MVVLGSVAARLVCENNKPVENIDAKATAKTPPSFSLLAEKSSAVFLALPRLKTREGF